MEKELAKLEQWELWIVAGIGLGLMLAGYRIKKIAFFIIWFLLGMTLVGYLMPWIGSVIPAIKEQELWQWLLPLAGGLLLALMGFSIEKFCVAGICFGLVLAVTVQYFGTEVQTILVGAVVGIIAGGLGTMMMKPAIIIATAVAGAYALTLSILLLFPNINEGAFYWPILIGGSVLGSVFQFFTTKHIS